MGFGFRCDWLCRERNGRNGVGDFRRGGNLGNDLRLGRSRLGWLVDHRRVVVKTVFPGLRSHVLYGRLPLLAVLSDEPCTHAEQKGRLTRKDQKPFPSSEDELESALLERCDIGVSGGKAG